MQVGGTSAGPAEPRGQLRPSYLQCPRVLHVYTQSVTDFVFEAMPQREDWL